VVGVSFEIFRRHVDLKTVVGHAVLHKAEHLGRPGRGKEPVELRHDLLGEPEKAELNLGGSLPFSSSGTVATSVK
jgi:hypothetical protein